MDYNNGTELYKGKYWDYVHNPITVIGALEGDEEGASNADPIIMTLLNKIKTSIKDNSTITIAEYVKLRTKGIYIGGFHYDFLHVNVSGDPGKPVTFSAQGKLTGKVTTGINAGTGTTPVAMIDINNGLIQIFAPSDRLVLLTNYLQSTMGGKNLLVFVNGYRSNDPYPTELPKPPDEVTFMDVNSYWTGVDAMFINRIGTRNVVYADGHHSVTTSNHGSIASFAGNMHDWSCVTSLTSLIYLITLPPAAVTCQALKINPNLFKLHTTANSAGFALRRSNGNKAGQDLLAKINSGSVVFDPQKDSIDIVCHSFGYAYSLGMIDALKASGKPFKFGRYYCIAPENAGSGGTNFNTFEEVWQYGSNEVMDKAWEQDGVAPQKEIKSLSLTGTKTKHGRVYFPEHLNPKDYLNCHYTKNYFWIFSDLKPNDPRGGYVKPR